MTRNKNNKGFTLVELIVVLAILAILAATLVPSLTGYIDKAKEKKDLTLARNFLVASQAVISDLYATSYDSICDAHTNNSCGIVIPLTNEISAPNRIPKLLRYYQTYDLISDSIPKNEIVYLTSHSEFGVVVEVLFYKKGTDYILRWTKETDSWEKVEYNNKYWEDIYAKCGSYVKKPNWNGGNAYFPR